MGKPKVLFLDIETAPILAMVWGIHDQNVGLNQIESDWSILSWAAKWLGEDEVMYEDLRLLKDKSNDKRLLKGVWKLMDEADIIVTQNGKSFDIKKLNARFIINGFRPPSSFQQIDTLRLARKHFGFTSNKLEYMTDKLNKKYKKLKHEKFAGIELWRECLRNNQKAWKEMEKYNKYDVLALEELYETLMPWDGNQTVNFSVYQEDATVKVCSCGSKAFINKGWNYSKSGKKSRFLCKSCGSAYPYSKMIPHERQKAVRP